MKGIWPVISRHQPSKVWQTFRNPASSSYLQKPGLIYSELGKPSLIFNDLGKHGLIYDDLGNPSLIYSDLGTPGLIYSDLGTPGLMYSDLGTPGLIYSDLRKYNTQLTAIFQDNPGKPVPECLQSAFYWS